MENIIDVSLLINYMLFIYFILEIIFNEELKQTQFLSMEKRIVFTKARHKEVLLKSNI
jgi:hypothetical protein